MNPNPLFIDKNKLVSEAFKLMKDNNISQLLVTNDDKYFGIIHLHDLIKEGF